MIDSVPADNPHSGESLPALVADWLEALRLQSWMLGRLPVKPPWGIEISSQLGWFHLLGAPCLVGLASQSADVRASPGDLIVVLPGHAHRLRDTVHSPLATIQELLGSFQREGIEHLGSDRSASSSFLVSGCFQLEDPGRTALLASLPPLIRLRGNGQRPLPYVERILRLIVEEAASTNPGAQALGDRLVRILLIKALQDHVSTWGGSDGCRLRALGDPCISRALALMHNQPGAPWTVASLAERVAMSRSVFSARFAELMGRPPLQYLSVWRMQKACQLLRSTRDELKEVAAKVGYESPSAFSKAFTRWCGVAPSAYRSTAATQGVAPAKAPPL